MDALTWVKARTLRALGIASLLRLAWYRLGIRTGFNRARWIRSSVPSGPFYVRPFKPQTKLPAPRRWIDKGCIFGWHSFPIDHRQPPEWFRNLVTGVRFPGETVPWWRIPDFSSGVGDIKALWEASRFDWVVAFAQQAVVTGPEYLDRLNHWIDDWCEHNPPYRGPNWKCGQEASIRVVHLAVAALILDQHSNPTAALRELIRLHLRRIATTLSYALAQNNNHGTSEAAALFIGGTWLNSLAPDRENGQWARLGRRWLENRVARLIEADGSFSQYSVNYHRLVVDTLSITEVWRRAFSLSSFSDDFMKKAGASVLWLKEFVQPESGDAPNIGANDGALIVPLTDADYRDFRPTVQLGSALFLGKRAYAETGSWNHALAWLKVKQPEQDMPENGNRLFDRGGYAVLRQGDAVAYLRYPRFRYRPAQADALHLDLWFAGRNILRDAGSYSYNTEQQWLEYFNGTAGHNTVQFDERDQMPRLGRFLFGDWLQLSDAPVLREETGRSSCEMEYRDDQGASHRRCVALSRDSVSVEDRAGGFKKKAVLRWRLSPDRWRIEGDSITNGNHSLTITADVPIVRMELVEGWESRYYLQRTSLPVLEVEINRAGTLTTGMSLGAEARSASGSTCEFTQTL